MEMFKKLLVTLFVTLSVISCGTAYNTESSITNGNYEIGSTKYLSGKVFQTITRHQALVELSNGPLVYVVTPSDCEEYLFDDLSIKGYYIFIGTHKYKTIKKDYDLYKTVPVFIHKDYYIKGMEWNDWYEKIDTFESLAL